MKRFCFTIDDNIRFMKELTERNYESIFDHPYLSLMKRLHDRFDLKIQLNLFYRVDGFDLSQMSDRYASQWFAVSDWLKLSFHSDRENVSPYEHSGYDEVFADCRAVNAEILRFAGAASLGETTTIHYCKTTADGLQALIDHGIRGLLGLYGSDENPRVSYSLADGLVKKLRNGQQVSHRGVVFAPIEMVINNFALKDIREELAKYYDRELLHVMIHEQFFYEDYRAYQPNFEEKLITVFEEMDAQGYKSCFFEQMLDAIE